ncbi:ComF family protein [Pseudoramibacter sp.]|jgi:ComF family protein|uniref:ComF family protein n=1 Tax=Pseudoramibacter sp. TaxID=2034862 RepID=UPI0025EA23AE|nr:ComF family protein [Pseudoramibacter sp.]MCH4071362.1 ComF family protein [Pseudoramibacter sp.]MCH4105130.1 ComF family protein [Pseudoramibacter sp.]
MSGSLLQRISRLLFIDNDRCPVCKKVLFDKEAYLCETCLKNLPVNAGPVCSRCGRPVLTHETVLCKSCKSGLNRHFDQGYVWLRYEEAAEQIAAGFKFRHQKTLADWAGRQMAAGLMEQPWIKEIEALIPVPLHPNRLAERGYNQSAHLARGLSLALRERGLEIAVDGDSLKRVVDTPHQVGQSADFRQQNVKNVFRAVCPEHLQGKRVALVDDVMTTGATLDNCAAALEEAGAEKVSIITFAATVG